MKKTTTANRPLNRHRRRVRQWRAESALLGRPLNALWTVREAAEHWRLPIKTVTRQFQRGHVPGGAKVDGRWRCPAGTHKPHPKRGRPVEKK